MTSGRQPGGTSAPLRCSDEKASSSSWCAESLESAERSVLQSAGVGRGNASNRRRAAQEVVGSERRAWSGRVLRRPASIVGGGQRSAGDLGGRR